MDKNILTTKRLTVIPASDDDTDKMSAEADAELAEAYRMMLNGSREHPAERLFYTPWMIFTRDEPGKGSAISVSRGWTKTARPRSVTE